MELAIYNQEGKESGKFNLPDELFNLSWNSDLVHQVTTAIAANNRQNSAYARARGQVRGGGKKPWRQKGTGRARHGSSRSPIWIGGGVTHGPTLLRDYSQKLSKKIRAKAFFVLMSKKVKDGEVLLVSLPDLATKKTKIAQTFLDKVAKTTGLPAMLYRRGNRVLVITPEFNQAVIKTFNNIPQVAVSNTLEVSPLDVLNYKYIMVTDPESAVAKFKSRAHFVTGEIKAPAPVKVAKKPSRKKVSATK